MKQFYLVETVTKDKLIHQGLYFEPKKRGKKAILWVHGLTDNFCGDLKILKTFTNKCEKLGWGLASFNNRGHEVIASLTKIDKSTPKGYTHFMSGAGMEKFSDCVLDIDAGITFLKSQGFSQVFIAGISTGANKVCYYAVTQKDPRVAGVILVSPISDVAIKMKELGNKYEETVGKVERMVKDGKGDSLIEGLDYMPLTPKRFLSLYKQNSSEDVFPYYQENPKFSVFSKITIPLMVVLGGADEYSDRPPRDIFQAFSKYQRSKEFKGIIISGAFHSFGGKEKEFVKETAEWIKSLFTA